MTNEAFMVIGHRGAMGYEPENTVRSVRRAVSQGVHGIEFDVRLAEGRLVVIHDATLERTTNGTGRVEAQSFENLRSLDAGNGERIPILEEMIAEIPSPLLLNVELKAAGTAVPAATILAGYGKEAGDEPDRFLLSAFNLEWLEEVRGCFPGMRQGVLWSSRSIGDPISSALELGAWSLHLELAIAEPALLERARCAGLQVYVFTVNSPSTAAQLKSQGACGVFTDYPDRILEGRRPPEHE